MAAITQILEVERENDDKIHLFREGLFLKAYQHSAFMFLNDVREFKVVKKYYKAVDGDVVMLGFPSGMLDKLLPDGNVEKIDEWHFAIPAATPFNEEEYRIWFSSVPLAPEKKKKHKEIPQLFDYEEPEPQAPVAVRIYEAEPVQSLSDAQAKVLAELGTFPIENSTPMECMIFLSKMKSELKKGTSGSL